MTKKIALALLAVIALGAIASGCMDREPAPICPVPIQVTSNEVRLSGFDGVDMLVVVDNSGSMAEEQEILATGFFTLINALVNPLSSSDVATSADDVRVAIVSSDMGLQWGGNLQSPANPTYNCDPKAGGDNGKFQTYPAGRFVNIAPNAIACESGGGQCPTGWNCSGGMCQPGSGDGTDQPCPAFNQTYAETTEASPNPNLAFQVACMAQLKTGGCGIEQQLEAAVAGLKRGEKNGFIRPNYLLAVLIVSDEEDCSIADKGLFETTEWKDQEKINYACNLPQSNEEKYLYATSRFREQFADIKGNQTAVVFAAIVGVPRNDLCQGTGNELSGCLDQDDMKLEIMTFNDVSGEYLHFKPACTRSEGGVEVTSARPGRRYVKVAQEFGSNGYVYSICNSDWGPAMNEIAQLIAQNLAGTCYDSPLEWDPVRKVAKCDVVAEFTNSAPGKSCPQEYQREFYEENGKIKSRAVAPEVYEAKVDREALYDDDDKLIAETVFCPVPKIPVSKNCKQAESDLANVEGGASKAYGWYYCEESGEDYDQACSDGRDNDGDGKRDGDDPDCADCAAGNASCDKSCGIVVQLTDAAKRSAGALSVQCLQQFSFEDENCQENTNYACNDNKDNDGNGVWDCNDQLSAEGGGLPHEADQNCCPLTRHTDGCTIDKAALNRICGGDFKMDKLPDACAAAMRANDCDPSNTTLN